MINRPLYIRKFHSGRLKEFGYNIQNTFEESKDLNEIIRLSDNQMMKTMRNIQKRTIDKKKVEILIQTRNYYRLQQTYQQTKKGLVTATTISNKLKKIKTKNSLTKRLYEKYIYITVNSKEAQRIQDKINRTLFQPDYVMVMNLKSRF